MKQIAINIFGLLFLILFLSSCEKFLEEVPDSFYASDNFYETLDQVQLAIIGVYDPLGNYNLYGHRSSCIYPLDSDISQISGVDNDGSKRTVAHYMGTPTTEWFEKSWQYYYKGINNANDAIDGIENMELLQNGSEEEKDQLRNYLGEAKFLRGLYYFDLVRMWGDVPLILHPAKATDDMNIPRSDREVVYDQIIQDFTDAKQLLFKESKTTCEHANEGAARGYLVRVYLTRAGYSLRTNGAIEKSANFMEYYKKAALEADSIIKSGEYTLLDSYEKIFRNYAENVLDDHESMFEVSFSPRGPGAENGGYISTYNGPKTNEDSSFGRANAYVLALWPFYESFPEGDLRKEVAVAPYEVLADDSRKYRTKDKEKANIYPGKWRREWNSSKPTYINDTDVNWCLLRYADILLMYAEAINELRSDMPSGLSIDVAYNAIDQIRIRAGLQSLERGLSQEELRDAIIDERGWELCFEGWRKNDLIRWNIMDKKIKEMKQKTLDVYEKYPYPTADYFNDHKHELYPIPQREMDINFNLAPQNPGY